ncbi:MAG TPA: sulfotransferase [Anaerolineae bacterium]|nr:sulfotransferase [Anaerolineae bacterium]
MSDRAIVVVSGLPRSGTSMMMKMLEAGGLPVLTDNLRTADEDNPRGYYEFERVKQIEEDREWLPAARGKVVKMISALLKHLPLDYRYRVVFMQREMGEILASQRQMLVRRGEDTERIDDQEMARLFARHLSQIESWLASQPAMDVLYVHYRDVLAEPAAQAARVNAFLGGGLDERKMAEVVDPELYRQKN